MQSTILSFMAIKFFVSQVDVFQFSKFHENVTKLEEMFDHDILGQIFLKLLGKNGLKSSKLILAIFWTFELLLHFDQFFSSNLSSGDNYASTINRINYLSENVLCSKNDEIVAEIYLKSLKKI